MAVATTTSAIDGAVLWDPDTFREIQLRILGLRGVPPELVQRCATGGTIRLRTRALL